MSITIGDAILYLLSDDSGLKTGLGKAEKTAQGWVNSLGSKIAMGLGMAVTAAIGGAVALGASAFKAGEQLDAAYDTLLIKTGASGAALQQLQTDFKAVFSGVATEAEPAANVLSVLYDRLKLAGEGAQGLGKDLLDASRLMKEDATQNTELFTRVMGDWAISNDNAQESLNKVFVASQKANVPMSSLMQTVVQFGAPLRQMGFSFDESIAMLAKWQAEGVNTELVLGSLRIAAGKFANEGKPLKESLLATFEAIKNAKSETEGLSIAMDVFGARAGPDMAAAIREGRFELDDMVAALQDADGAISDTAKQTEDWGEKLTKLKNKATLALAPIGMKLMDVASVLLDKAGPALDWFTGILDTYLAPALDRAVDAFTYLWDRLSAGDDLFTMFEDGSTILGAFFERLGMGEGDAEALASKIIEIKNAFDDFLNGTLIPFVTEHAEEIKAALIAIGAALAAAAIVTTVTSVVTAVAALANPLGLIIALVAVLAAAWAGNWGGIREKTASAIEFIKGLIAGGMQFINDFVNGRLGLLSQIFQTAWQNVQLVFQAFQAAFSGDWYRFGELLRQVWDNYWRLIGTILTTAWTNIQTGVKNGIQAVKDFFTTTDWSSVGSNILKGIAKGITNGLSIIRDAAVAAAKAALAAAQGFLGIKSPSTKFAEEVGEPSAEGFGKGFAKRMGEMGTESGQQALGAFEPVQSLGGSAGGSVVTMQVNYQPVLALSDEVELERVLRPVFERLMRSFGIARGATSTS